MAEYKEIVELYEYCKSIGVHAEKSLFLDGLCIRFENGGDIVQH